MKDAAGCEKPRLAVKQAIEPRMSEWGNPIEVMLNHSGLNT